ncbi:DUF928 domain-containing protein [Granulicella sibirica]|uniref:DUF928 domain-containing protein n=1 Tax=Granulicella sibirica TaxID=2479048 RepID=UPI001008E2E3|nr:DUF928 domain-containing protein [Granulicella sibirica]
MSILKVPSVCVLTFCLSFGLSSSSFTACAQAPGAQKPVRVRAKLDGFDIEPKSGKAPNQIGGASRGIGGLTLYAPKMGKAYTLTPTFMWSADDATAEYTFRLSVLSAGQGQMFETKVMGGTFMYPADAPALMPGATYVWQVTPANDMFGGPASANILIVGGAEREAVDAALHGKPGMTAADAKVYVDKRLWYDAVATYSSLIASDPSHGEYYKGRAELYDQFQQTQPLADADMSKAQH